MKITTLVCVLVLGVLGLARAADPSAEAKAASDKLIAAIAAADHAAFVADGDAAFKGLKKEVFDAVAAQLVPRFRAGYEVAYLGEMKQQGYQVTLWKLSFKDGGDDALATLSMKDGKVGGYWIR